MSEPADRSTVSVVIPSYNHARYVSLAIESVLAQTYLDWEAIVVDDGSTDETQATVARFTDPRVRYLYQENQGLSAARNAGIRIAHGEYLAFLDADDEWAPDFLRRCVEALAADETVAGVYTRCHFIDQHGTILPQLGGETVDRAEFRRRIEENGFFPPCAALVRAAIVRKVGMFDTQLAASGTEDWDLWLRISEHYTMHGIPDFLARYRVAPDSMSANAGRMHASRTSVLTKHFGPPDGDPAEWPNRKRRAYACAYRSSAYYYIQQGQVDEGWHWLAQAVSIWPDLLQRLDTFYELACGDQPRGYRGNASLLDLESNGIEMLRGLSGLLDQSGPLARSLHSRAYGNAYLALGMLSEQADNWAAVRGYLIKAMRADPRLMRSYPVIRRFLKSCAGPRLARLMRLAGHSKRGNSAQAKPNLSSEK